MTRKSIFFILFVVLLTGCTTSNRYVTSDQIINKPIQKQKTEIKKETTHKEELVLNKKNEELNKNQAFRDFYDEWKGVKYKLGGNSKKGIDCSAFTQRAFKEKFNVAIPRTTRTQVNSGKRIPKSELELGDLVFFKTGKTDRHVGIYMGDGTFLHASIKGVKYTKLDKPFYKKAYWTSRRVIQ